MSANNYFNLYMDADITQDQERYGRCLDAVVGQEGIGVDDIFGVGENGTGGNKDLFVVHRKGVTVTSERGLFNKRIEVNHLCTLASIERLRATQEGFKGTELTITGTDSSGNEVLKITWGLGGPDWVEPMVLRQRENLFGVISEAMDRLVATPTGPSVSSASSKAGALMDWAARLVEAAGVEVTNDRVEEHANMAAGAVSFAVFLPLGAPRGIQDLSMYFPDGEMPAGTPIQGFDELYGHVVTQVGDAQAVDNAIDSALAGCWNEWVEGCRSTYS